MRTGATKALLGAVIVMGVLIVVGTAVLVSVVIRRALHGDETAPVAALSVTPVARSLGEPAGTRIAAAVRQSDRLLDLLLTGGGPDRIVVWDVVAGHVVSRLSARSGAETR